jgi:hypothetical protein
MNKQFDVRRFFKWLGLSIAVIMAIAIPLGLVGPTRPDTNGYDSAVTAANVSADVANATASGAPQQQVVNGWLARDLMVIQIRQRNDELALLHLAVALMIGTLLAIVVAGVAASRGRSDDAETPSATDLTATE